MTGTPALAGSVSFRRPFPTTPSETLGASHGGAAGRKQVRLRIVIGLAIKQQSPFKQTFTIELANGCNGYRPPPEQH